MRGIGFAMALVGLVIPVVCVGDPHAFVNLPGLFFVIFVGLGITLAGHGTSGVCSIPSALAGQPDSVERAKPALETSIQAFVAAGWIGVLIGIIQMLSALDDPAELGAGMATCLLTAFYGYIGGYMICMPLSRSCSAKPQVAD